MEKNLVGKRFFNLSAFQMLSNKVASEPDDLEIITDAVKDFTSYVQDVDVGEQQIRSAYATLDGEELRERVANIDARRRSRHETAISSARVLNKMAEIYNVSAVFTGDFGDRIQVADFCLDITVELFDNRRK